ncbi:hypothetical protein ABZ646_23025 [Streptomyces sp. NPDC007162]
MSATADPVFVAAHLAMTPQGRPGTVDGGYAAHGPVKAVTDALDRV